MRSVHAGELEQCMEPGPLGDSAADWPGHRHPGGVAELYARGAALQEPLRQCTDGRNADRLGDTYAHPSHYGFAYAEAILTGAISGLLALAGSYLFEDRARRIRTAWARLFG